MQVQLTAQEALLIAKILRIIEANVEHLPADLEVLYATQEPKIKALRRRLYILTGS